MGGEGKDEGVVFFGECRQQQASLGMEIWNVQGEHTIQLQVGELRAGQIRDGPQKSNSRNHFKKIFGEGGVIVGWACLNCPWKISSKKFQSGRARIHLTGDSMLCGAHCKPYTGASAAVNQEFIGLVRAKARGSADARDIEATRKRRSQLDNEKAGSNAVAKKQKKQKTKKQSKLNPGRTRHDAMVDDLIA